VPKDVAVHVRSLLHSKSCKLKPVKNFQSELQAFKKVTQNMSWSPNKNCGYIYSIGTLHCSSYNLTAFVPSFTCSTISPSINPYI
jgi:hypothetical protein